MSTAIWRLPDGREARETVTISAPRREQPEVVERLRQARRTRGSVSQADRDGYWSDFPARNPLTWYRVQQGELEWRDVPGEPSGGGYFPRSGGRPSDGAVFVGLADEER